MATWQGKGGRFQSGRGWQSVPSGYSNRGYSYGPGTKFSGVSGGLARISTNFDRQGNPINWAQVDRINQAYTNSNRRSNSLPGRAPGSAGRSLGSGKRLALQPARGTSSLARRSSRPVLPRRSPTGNNPSKRMPGWFKFAAAGAGVFALGVAGYQTMRGSARDLNRSLGNPASTITGWHSYNRSRRGY